MKYVSYTIYPPAFDPAPGRGNRPAMVGFTVKPTPSLTRDELLRMIAELQHIADKMKDM